MGEPFLVCGLSASFVATLASYDPTDDMIAKLSGEHEAEEPERTLEKARLAELVEMLPLVEQDLLRLRAEGKRQEDCATIFGLTQAAVSYRLIRARQRLRFLAEFPMPSEEKLRADLVGVLTEQQITVLWDVSLTTSQSLSARRLNITQGRVRHTMMVTAKRLNMRDEPQLAPYRTMINMLLDKRNMNLLHVQPGPKGYQGRKPEFIGRLAAAVANDSGLEGLHCVRVVDSFDAASPANEVTLDFAPGLGVHDVENK